MKDNNKYIPKHASLSDTQRFLVDDFKEDRLNNNKDNYNDDGFWTSKIKLVKNHDKDKKKNSKKIFSILYRIVYILLIILFLVLIIISSYKIYLWVKDNKKTSSITDKISNEVVVNEVEDDNNTSLVGEENDKDNPYWYYVKFPLIDVDISSLKKINSDVIGWVNVNNTNINYPFVQTNDNDYYLNHSIDKSSNEAGWIFLDYRNRDDLSNRNSILYAHSRLDKSMFGSLSRVLKSDWYSNKDNHIIRISLDDSSTLWQIFSVYKIKEESYYITTNFSNDNEYMNFLDTIKKRSLYDFNTSLNKDDKILTLSTCYSETERTVVHAKLIKKSKKD
ncbi:MAG: class B sortase [Bacilli bacterium]|nr:class B sortase [Bacilli bacterium]